MYVKSYVVGTQRLTETILSSTHNIGFGRHFMDLEGNQSLFLRLWVLLVEIIGKKSLKMQNIDKGTSNPMLWVLIRIVSLRQF